MSREQVGTYLATTGGDDTLQDFLVDRKLRRDIEGHALEDLAIRGLLPFQYVGELDTELRLTCRILEGIILLRWRVSDSE